VAGSVICIVVGVLLFGSFLLGRGLLLLMGRLVSLSLLLLMGRLISLGLLLMGLLVNRVKSG